MSSANLLPPSAPPAKPLYPVVEAEPSQNFRLQKVNEISNTLAGEVHHYRIVAKKYKRVRKFVNWGAAGSSVLSAAFSSASFGSALYVVGLPAAVPLGGAGGCFALVSSALILAGKKLNSKIKKHQEITTLAVAKRDTINRLLSNALELLSTESLLLHLTETWRNALDKGLKVGVLFIDFRKAKERKERKAKSHWCIR